MINLDRDVYIQRCYAIFNAIFMQEDKFGSLIETHEKSINETKLFDQMNVNNDLLNLVKIFQLFTTF